jgi:hypothetical protein
MSIDRLIEIFGLLADRDGGESPSRTLCRVAAGVTKLSGASIALYSQEHQLTSLGTSNPTSHELLDLEMVLGEGPCIDASLGDDAVDEGHLESPTNMRWLAYTPMALSLGACAVFAFPLRIGAVRLGALSLYRDQRGELTESQSSDCYLMASVVSRAVLAMQAGAPADTLAVQLEGEGVFDFTTHQAAGMVAVQGTMPIGDAMLALRSQAFSSNSTLSSLAGRVVSRSVHFDPTSGEWHEGQSRRKGGLYNGDN